MIDEELLNILVCPRCKGKLEYDEENERLLCNECKLAYPIREGIPVMLIDESEEI